MENLNINETTVKKNSFKFVILVCLIVISVFSILTFLKTNQVVSTISVSGKSEILAKPDFVKLIVTRVNTGNGVTTAIDDGTIGIDRLITIARQLDDQDIEIKQTIYQVTNSGTSYSVANAFSVKTSKIENIDELVKKLYTNGATSVSNITYESSDIKNVEEKLRSQVYLDAKDKAKRIAKSAGKRLGKVVSIVDDDTTITSTIEDLKDNQGLINISKTASVVYKIW